MEQHAIPQNVSSYQFKLVGDMTLKQFFQVAGGILVGIIFFNSPLLAIIRWPLAILSVLLGIGLAFLPLEERPLETWIFAFFRAIYSPTIFNWKKDSVSTKLFQDETIPLNTPQQDVALNDYLSKTGHEQTALKNLDKAETNFFEKLTGLFNLPNTTKAASQTVNTPQNIVPQENLVATVPPAPRVEPSIIQGSNVSIAPPTPLNTFTSESTAKELKIPETPAVTIPTTNTHVVVEEQALHPSTPNPATSAPVSPVIAGDNMISTKQAFFSIDAAPPSPPTYPNVVVGQVIDQDRRIVEGVIMEIRDSEGRPIRALRSNKVGHFITVTQLDNGHYEIITEKDGYEFSPASFEATGSIIPPILIQGKRLSPLIEMPAVPVKPAYSIN